MIPLQHIAWQIPFARDIEPVSIVDTLRRPVHGMFRLGTQVANNPKLNGLRFQTIFSKDCTIVFDFA